MTDFIIGFMGCRIPILCIVMLLTLAGSGRADWWQEKAFPDTLAAQDLANHFQFVDSNNQQVTPELTEVQGRQVIISGKNELKFTGWTYKPECEVIIRFGMNPPAGVKANLTADITDALKVTVSGTGGSDDLEINAAGSQLTQKLRGVYQRSLNYSDELRKILDYQISTHPELSERWLSVRYVLRSDKCEVYVNDILIKIVDKASPGELHVTLSPNVQLLSITSRPLENNPLFEPVRIDSRLNASKIGRLPIIQDDDLQGQRLSRLNLSTYSRDAYPGRAIE